jgi:hypothetical protein
MGPRCTEVDFEDHGGRGMFGEGNRGVGEKRKRRG